VGVVREIMEFYYRKAEGIIGVASARWNEGTWCRKKRKNFNFRLFLYHP
jgi:hypothetical protein